MDQAKHGAQGEPERAVGLCALQLSKSAWPALGLVH